MNELISKLKQQAGIDYNPDQEGLDLFAELIIKECITKIEEAAEYSPELYGVALDIQDYFGVEE